MRGFTLIEIMVVMVMSAILLAVLGGVVEEAVGAQRAASERNRLAQAARFALERVVRASRHSPRLLVPFADIATTGGVDESIREPGVLALTLDPTIDRDSDGFVDVDNDKDGRIDEDLPADSNNDGQPGISGIDDDADGLIDETGAGTGIDDDDESGTATDEDFLNGLDDDADGLVDEDPPDDMNNDTQPGVAGVDDDGDGIVDEGAVGDDDEDGSLDEDWYDSVVFDLNGTDLIERTPVPWDQNGDTAVDGRDFVSSVIAENVSRFRVQRLPEVAGQPLLLDLTLELTDSSGATILLNTRVRVGGAL